MDPRSSNLIAALALALADRVEHEVEAVCGRSGASAAALTSVLAEPGLSVRQLSVILGISGSGVVRLVDRLADDGMLERRAGQDARETEIHLTDAGVVAAQQVLAVRRERIESALSGVSAEEYQLLGRVAATVLAGLTDSVDAGCRLCRLCDWGACPLAQCPVEQALP